MRFYATREHLLSVIAAIESRYSLKYCETGLFDSPEATSYPSLGLIPKLGIALRDSAHSPNYLVLSTSCEVQVRAIPQRSGGIKYAVDQLSNPDTISFRPGGIHKEGVLIEGTISTAYKAEFSQPIIKLFRRAIAQYFQKFDYGCYIGVQAKLLAEQGWRLVQSESQPQEYDQKINKPQTL
ncbi:hypothetical protein [Hymenobacter latericus]|uniref:hypothetical protein n=1 Tax=Hymenobacter sp. YIM 151858-1 TaxID=2987688 RepID=UPI00222806C5|nr:hypothetical protein [Hymenobacter sp. YIM 151858-1]UYZ59319.1 hypothetical protein OIS50_00625 [Hymenobacter sp. YIM 151858-1]